jgi:hypothetical protein
MFPSSRYCTLLEIIRWMADSPWWAVRQHLLSRGYTINEINSAANHYVKETANV